MNWKRMWVMFIARNKEYFRDKSAFGWNLLFPFLIILGFGIIFGGDSREFYKIGIFPVAASKVSPEDLKIPDGMKKMKYVEFIGFPDQEKGMELLMHHKIDLLLGRSGERFSYWVSNTSPRGYVAEQMIMAALAPAKGAGSIEKKLIEGIEIKYIDWLFPGILAMNMMFSALWGVGYVIVRYRKNGVLKRLKATPLTALEYLSAQMLSRIFLLMFSLVIVWIGCNMIFNFRMAGSYFNVFLIFLLGGCSLTALGLLVACRGISEEFTSGVLNFITWPMMFLSEVWFSLEGAPDWVKWLAKLFPLTHINNAVRKVMNDGATLADVSADILILALLTVVSLVLGARLFTWSR